MTTIRTLGALLISAFAAAYPAAAQTFPDRLVKIVVPAGPGGPTDLAARLVAAQLSTTIGQSVIVENRPGAGGMVGARAVAAADPDGHTLLLGNTAVLANIPAVSPRAGYNPVTDFMAVSKILDSFQVIIVHPDVPAKTIQEFLAYARANPGKLNFGAAGQGNLTHLAGELLKLKAGIDFVAVHYGTTGFLQPLMANQVQFAIESITAAMPLIQEGKVRALAVTSAERKPQLPDLPTMLESGVPDFVVTSFFGIVAPAKTPPAVVAKLNSKINAAIRSEKLADVIKKLGATAAQDSPETFNAYIAAEIEKWRRIADSAGIKVD